MLPVPEKTKQAQIAVVAFFEPAEVQRNGVYAEQRHQRVVVGTPDEKVILHNRVGKKNKTAEQCQVDIELPAQAVCQGYGRQDAEPGGKERPAEENGVAQVAEMQNGMAFTAQRMSIGRVQCRISPNG